MQNTGRAKSLYTQNLRLDHLSDRIQFRLPVTILDTLEYIGLDKLALRMGMDALLAVLAVKQFQR